MSSLPPITEIGQRARYVYSVLLPDMRHLPSQRDVQPTKDWVRTLTRPPNLGLFFEARSLFSFGNRCAATNFKFVSRCKADESPVSLQRFLSTAFVQRQNARDKRSKPLTTNSRSARSARVHFEQRKLGPWAGRTPTAEVTQ